MSSWRARPVSTSYAYTDTSRGPSCTRRPTVWMLVGRTSLAMGIRGGAARRSQAAPWSIYWPPPSIVLWCGHNEPFALDIAAG